MNVNLHQRILKIMHAGLPIVSRPFLSVANAVGVSEGELLDEIKKLKSKGIVKRFGLVVKHHEIGYKHNAMVVWNISDDKVRAVAHLILQHPFVTLCYQRPRRLPQWNYNLYCMIHGQDRNVVLAQIEMLKKTLNEKSIQFKHDVLFSTRKFKQVGANYFRNLEEVDVKIINSFQDGVPIESRPFEKFAQNQGISEWEVVYRIDRLMRDGYFTRFGPLYNIDKGGGQFVLCAMKVSEDQYDQVAERVNSFSEVAHNYKRDHDLNMWFVLAVEKRERVADVVREIEKISEHKVYAFPKLKEYFVDLRFQI